MQSKHIYERLSASRNKEGQPQVTNVFTNKLQRMREKVKHIPFNAVNANSQIQCTFSSQTKHKYHFIRFIQLLSNMDMGI